MGGHHSKTRKIVKQIFPPRSRAFDRRPVAGRCCRDVCGTKEFKYEEHSTPCGSRKPLASRLQDVKCEGKEKKVKKSVKDDAVSCQTSIILSEDLRGGRSKLKMKCIGEDVDDVEAFFKRHSCHLGGEKDGRCAEREAHVHGFLNGVPIVLKLPRPSEDDSKVSRNAEKIDHTGSATDRSVSQTKEESTQSQPDILVPKTEPERGKKRACDGGVKHSGSGPEVAEKSESGIESVKNSPCSFSRECLSTEYSFHGPKCEEGKECVEKCASAAIKGETSGPSGEESKKKEVHGKPKSQGKPWIKPPIPALKAQPLTDLADAPAHIWYGDKAYPFVDEEPKPKNTFNSENTARKKNARDVQKTVQQEGKQTTETKTANIAKNIQNSPFKSAGIPTTDIGTEIELANNSPEDREVVLNEAGVSRGLNFGTCPEYTNYPVLPDEKNRKTVSEFSVSFYEICTNDLGSKYAFLCEKYSADDQRAVLSLGRKFSEDESRRSLLDPRADFPRQDFCIAPAWVSKFYKNLSRRRKSSRICRTLETTTIPISRQPQETQNESRTLLIARTPQPNVIGSLMMGAKTVITVRENSTIRLYSETCGAEDDTEDHSRRFEVAAQGEDKSCVRNVTYGLNSEDEKVAKPVHIILPTRCREAGTSPVTSFAVCDRADRARKASKKSSWRTGKASKSKSRDCKQTRCTRSREPGPSDSQPSDPEPQPISEEPQPISEETRPVSSPAEVLQVDVCSAGSCSKNRKNRRTDKKDRKGKENRADRNRRSGGKRSSKACCSEQKGSVGFFESVKNSCKNQFRRVKRAFRREKGRSSSKRCGYSTMEAECQTVEVSRLTSGTTLDEVENGEEKPEEVKLENEVTKDGENGEKGEKPNRGCCKSAHRKKKSSQKECKARYYDQPCECRRNPGKSADLSTVCRCGEGVCDGTGNRKCCVLPCCVKPASSPPQTKSKKTKSGAPEEREEPTELPEAKPRQVSENPVTRCSFQILEPVSVYPEKICCVPDGNRKANKFRRAVKRR